MIKNSKIITNKTQRNKKLLVFNIILIMKKAINKTQKIIKKRKKDNLKIDLS